VICKKQTQLTSVAAISHFLVYNDELRSCNAFVCIATHFSDHFTTPIFLRPNLKNVSRIYNESSVFFASLVFFYQEI